MECRKVCNDISQRETIILNIDSLKERTWTTTSIVVIPSGKTTMTIPRTIRHYETTVFMSNGEVHVFSSGHIKNNMKVKKIPIYKPNKIEENGVVRYEPKYIGFKYKVTRTE